MANTRPDGATHGLHPVGPTHGQHPQRHVLPGDLAAELRAARQHRGLGLRQAARTVGIAAGSLTLLEQGKRCPSIAVARGLAAALALEPDFAARLLAVARPGVGHSREAHELEHWDPPPAANPPPAA